MACFICQNHGHWSRNCPLATCKFCGEKGHSHAVCPSVGMIAKKATATEEEVCVRVSRTRSKKVSGKTLSDILFDHHVYPGNTMRDDVDAFVKENFTKRGMVDEHALVEHVFENTAVSLDDYGHVSVFCYIIQMYCAVSHEAIKDFLRQVSPDTRKKWHISAFTKNGTVHFRKFVGASV